MEWTSADLKRRLSEALERVAMGAVIRVVDRGVVKGVLAQDRGE
jgi:prevent-host-death family protein